MEGLFYFQPFVRVNNIKLDALHSEPHPPNVTALGRCFSYLRYDLNLAVSQRCWL